jgi:hypothetical protein
MWQLFALDGQVRQKNIDVSLAPSAKSYGAVAGTDKGTLNKITVELTMKNAVFWDVTPC